METILILEDSLWSHLPNLCSDAHKKNWRLNLLHNKVSREVFTEKPEIMVEKC